MAYQIAMMTEHGTETHRPEDLEAWLDDMGLDIQGYNENPRQRAELQGQPKSSGLYGPFWGDYDHEGEPVIRYEDAETYRSMSM
ncbi:hypothetical protein [Paracoccus cavernae]|uniref:hypothetical protein n=1 Tax=Paracoccus cavernae TaxID=1571207 RepID=UPI0035F380B0